MRVLSVSAHKKLLRATIRSRGLAVRANDGLSVDGVVELIVAAGLVERASGTLALTPLRAAMLEVHHPLSWKIAPLSPRW